MFETSEYYEHLEQVESYNKSIKLVWTSLNLFKFVKSCINLLELVQAQKSIYRAVLDSFWILLLCINIS